MDYKVGDKVRITKHKAGDMRADFLMDQRLGETMTIKSIDNGRYEMEEDDRKRYRYPEMIEGLAETFEEGDEVLVRDTDLEKRNKRIFILEVPGKADLKYICVSKGDEKEYNNGEKFTISIRKQIKLPKKVSIELTEEQLEKVKEIIDL